MADFKFLNETIIKIRDLVVPPAPAGYEQSEIFLSLVPGFSVRPDSFDPGYADAGNDPDLNLIDLLDNVPVIDNHFVATPASVTGYMDMLYKAGFAPGQDGLSEEQQKKLDKAKQNLKAATAALDEMDKVRKAANDLWSICRSDYTQSIKNMTPEEKRNRNHEWKSDPETSRLSDKFEIANKEWGAAKMEVERSIVDVLSICSGDLKSMWSEACMEYEMSKVVNFSSGQKIHVPTCTPDDWYLAFGSQAKPNDSSLSWMSVEVKSSDVTDHKDSELNKTSASMEASYGGLWCASAKGGFSSEEGNSHALSSDTEVNISFEIARVKVSRNYLDSIWPLLSLSGVGVKGLAQNVWSTGSMEAANKGHFPLLINGFIVARNVSIDFVKTDTSSSEKISKLGMDASAKAGFGPFAVSGNFHKEKVKSSSDSEFKKEGTKISIPYAQIIGFTATLVPAFPTVDLMNGHA